MTGGGGLLGCKDYQIETKMEYSILYNIYDVCIWHKHILIRIKSVVSHFCVLFPSIFSKFFFTRHPSDLFFLVVYLIINFHAAF